MRCVIDVLLGFCCCSCSARCSNWRWSTPRLEIGPLDTPAYLAVHNRPGVLGGMLLTMVRRSPPAMSSPRWPAQTR